LIIIAAVGLIELQKSCRLIEHHSAVGLIDLNNSCRTDRLAYKMQACYISIHTIGLIEHHSSYRIDRVS
jgi:hypothetical protein